MIAVAGFLLVASVASIVLLGMEFLPETDEGRLTISLETTGGIPARADLRTDAGGRAGRARRARARTSPRCRRWSAARAAPGSGATGSHLAEVSVNLVAKDRRVRDIWTIADALSRRIAAEVRDVKAGISVEGIASLVNLVAGDANPVVVEIEGEDLAGALALAGSVAGVVAATPGARDVDVSYKTGKPEMQLRVKHEEAAGLGVSPLAVAATVRAAFKGVEVSRYRNGDDTWDVHVRLRDEDRAGLADVNGLFLVNAAGSRIPLENLVDVVTDEGPVSIQRANKVRLVKVTAALTGDALARPGRRRRAGGHRRPRRRARGAEAGGDRAHAARWRTPSASSRSRCCSVSAWST